MAKHAGGRPTLYSQELAQKICDKTSTCTMGLTELCKTMPGWPDKDSVNVWRLTYPEFSAKYAEAKRQQAELLVEEIVQLSDQSHTYCDEAGNLRYDAAFTSAQRLKVDTRKWLASKLIPKVYGEKVIQESTVTIKHEDALKELE